MMQFTLGHRSNTDERGDTSPATWIRREEMEKEVSKAEFKKAYMQYRGDNDGWSDGYWQRFFEDEEGKRYFFSPPESPRHNRLFITTSSDHRHMYFLTPESEEGFFDYPGKT